MRKVRPRRLTATGKVCPVGKRQNIWSFVAVTVYRTFLSKFTKEVFTVQGVYILLQLGYLL